MDCWFSLASQSNLIDKLWVKKSSCHQEEENGFQAMVFKIVLWHSHAQAHTQAHLYRNIHITHAHTPHTQHTHTLHERSNKLLKPHFMHREIFRSKMTLMLSVGVCWPMQSKLRRNGSSQVKVSQPKNTNNMVAVSAYLCLRHELDHGFIVCPWTSGFFKNQAIFNYTHLLLAVHFFLLLQYISDSPCLLDSPALITLWLLKPAEKCSCLQKNNVQIRENVIRLSILCLPLKTCDRFAWVLRTLERNGVFLKPFASYYKICAESHFTN